MNDFKLRQHSPRPGIFYLTATSMSSDSAITGLPIVVITRVLDRAPQRVIEWRIETADDERLGTTKTKADAVEFVRAYFRGLRHPRPEPSESEQTIAAVRTLLAAAGIPIESIIPEGYAPRAREVTIGDDAALGTLATANRALFDAAIKRAQRQALAEMLSQIDGWIEGSRSNHDAEVHSYEVEPCWEQFHPNDIRRMVYDAARACGITDLRLKAGE